MIDARVNMRMASALMILALSIALPACQIARRTASDGSNA